MTDHPLTDWSRFLPRMCTIELVLLVVLIAFAGMFWRLEKAQLSPGSSPRDNTLSVEDRCMLLMRWAMLFGAAFIIGNAYYHTFCYTYTP